MMMMIMMMIIIIGIIITPYGSISSLVGIYCY